MRAGVFWAAAAAAVLVAVPVTQAASAAPIAARTGPALNVTLQLALPNPAGLTALAQSRALNRRDRLARLAALSPSVATGTRVAGLVAREGLTVTGRTPFSVRLSGPASVVNAVFGHSLGAGGKHQGLRLPASMVGLVAAAVGGDDTRKAFHHQVFTPTPVTGATVRSLYNAPAGTPANGSTQTVATIQLSGWDNRAFGTFATRVGRPNPVATHRYAAVPVDGADPTAPDGNGGDVEVALDQESIYDTAPSALQRAYFAPNTLVSFVDAINRIATDAASTAPDLHLIALSISWGLCEANLTAPEVTAFSSAFAAVTAAGVTTFAASGDEGPYDCSRPEGPTNTTAAVDYPSSDPNVVGVGGTTVDARVLATPAEQTWWQPCPCNQVAAGFAGFGGGGGSSSLFGKPSYQTGLVPGRTGRLVPDIGADANGNSGFVIDFGFGATVGRGLVGGTSLASPLSAASFSNLLAEGGFSHGIGDIHPMLYTAPARSFRDITTGIDGNLAATTGYDLATGLGAPQWGQFASALYPAIPGSTYTPVTPAGCSTPATAPPAAPAPRRCRSGRPVRPAPVRC
jgi:hypothetical protein